MLPSISNPTLYCFKDSGVEGWGGKYMGACVMRKTQKKKKKSPEQARKENPSVSSDVFAKNPGYKRDLIANELIK